MDEAEKLTLMQLVDGELTAEEAAVATASCREQPGAAAHVAALVGDRALLRAAFPPETADATRLVAAIDAAFASGRRRPNPFLSRAALPVAASVLTAVLVGTGGVMLANRQAEDTAARVVAALGRDRQLTAAAFGEALDKQLSGQSVAWRNPDTGSSGSITPCAPFVPATDASVASTSSAWQGLAAPSALPALPAATLRDGGLGWSARAKHEPRPPAQAGSKALSSTVSSAAWTSVTALPAARSLRPVM